MIAAVVAIGWAVRDGHLLRTGASNLFFGELEGDLLDDYRGVVGVAHNAGDRLANARLALEHGADVIEIDVAASQSTLYASHTVPPQLARPSTFDAPTLHDSWRLASERPVVMLDLKQSSRSFLSRVVTFLHSRPSANTILVSRSPAALEFLAAEVPEATLLLSSPGRSQIDLVLRDDELASRIHGVSAFSGVLDEATIAQLKERGFVIYAWVVNRMPIVNELVAAGVDGIITDNIAILRLLSDPAPEPEDSPE